MTAGRRGTPRLMHLVVRVCPTRFIQTAQSLLYRRRQRPLTADPLRCRQTTWHLPYHVVVASISAQCVHRLLGMCCSALAPGSTSRSWSRVDGQNVQSQTKAEALHHATHPSLHPCSRYLDLPEVTAVVVLLLIFMPAMSTDRIPSMYVWWWSVAPPAAACGRVQVRIANVGLGCSRQR